MAGAEADDRIHVGAHPAFGNFVPRVGRVVGNSGGGEQQGCGEGHKTHKGRCWRWGPAGQDAR